MQKATVTYVAPPGDSKVVEMGGVTFFDGKSVEINTYDNPSLIQKLKGNPHFDMELGKEDDQPPPKRKVGRPSKADIEAAKVAADDAAKEAEAAKKKAEEAKSDHDKLSKQPEREVTKQPTEQPKADLKAGMTEGNDHDFEADRRAALAKSTEAERAQSEQAERDRMAKA